MNEEETIHTFMKEAIREAKLSLSEGGVPIGSVLVKDDRIVGRGHNLRVQRDDPMSHAEVEAIRNAGRIGTYRGTIIYSTLMPCYFCAGAIVQFGIRKVIAGESENFTGAREFLEGRDIEVIDLNMDECKRLMKSFIERNPQIWREDIGTL